MSLGATAQKKSITLEEIWNGTFKMEYLDRLHSMSNGKEYSVINTDRAQGTRSIDIYSYETGEKVKTLVNSSEINGLDYFTSYNFSKDESKVLLGTNIKSIFRRSSIGDYFVYDIKSKQLTKVASEPIQEPTFSPDATKVAYGLNNNLYIKNLQTGETTQVTNDGEKNKIINGITDWVYEEEFSLVRAFDWNAAGDKLAFIRFDETEVPEFSMDVYGTDLYQKQDVFKYPKAGEPNSKVSLHIYDLAVKMTNEISLANFENY
ncbi:MAG: DPP IV N-terminal domain-containing protein, partial [Leeuwenhoekiella sp.]